MSWRVRSTAARMSSRSLPALPTNGSPVASSFSPGPSPTSISGECASPVPKTVLVRLRARSHLVQTATCRASSASRSSRFSPPSAASKRLSTAPPRVNLATFHVTLFYPRSAGSGAGKVGLRDEHHRVSRGQQVLRGLLGPRGHRVLRGRGPHSRGRYPRALLPEPLNERTRRFLNQILHV